MNWARALHHHHDFNYALVYGINFYAFWWTQTVKRWNIFAHYKLSQFSLHLIIIKLVNKTKSGMMKNNFFANCSRASTFETVIIAIATANCASACKWELICCSCLITRVFLPQHLANLSTVWMESSALRVKNSCLNA